MQNTLEIPSVLLSVKPKYCGFIASGKKSIELRKTKPKIETPFKCYIYCTKEFYRKGDGYFQGKYCGKIIGEFVCDEILCFPYVEGEEAGEYVYNIPTVIGEQTCLDYGDVSNYGNGKSLYFWHISNLVIYDEPKELSEFYKHDNTYDNAFGWVFKDRPKKVPIKRPPQSWCYVEG